MTVDRLESQLLRFPACIVTAKWMFEVKRKQKTRTKPNQPSPDDGEKPFIEQNELRAIETFGSK